MLLYVGIAEEPEAKLKVGLSLAKNRAMFAMCNIQGVH
jgi:hypothetical protein